jgi:TetR/AcrR family transcriptional repressor of nem operon
MMPDIRYIIGIIYLVKRINPTEGEPMSKASREQAQQNRERVVDTASRLFRERGFDGVGIADLMKAAGLTHGGFYAQFPSKEHLMAEAASKGLGEFDQKWRKFLAHGASKSLASMADMYLSKEHRDDPGAGCVSASLAIDASHHGPLVRSALTRGVRRSFDVLMQLIPGRSQKTKRREAIASFAAMVGGVVLARGVNDESLSDEILEAVRAHLSQIEGPTSH